MRQIYIQKLVAVSHGLCNFQLHFFNIKAKYLHFEGEQTNLYITEVNFFEHCKIKMNS